MTAEPNCDSSADGICPNPHRDRYISKRALHWARHTSGKLLWPGFRKYYRERLGELFRLSIPAGARVLELGCGAGDLLASLSPSLGVGIDINETLVAEGRTKYPEISFTVADVHLFNHEGTFDFIICSDILNEVWDLQELFQRLTPNCHRRTRLLINTYSRLWEAPRKIAASLGLAVQQLPQNWLTVDDLSNLLHLGGFEVIRSSPEIMCPIDVPILKTFFNKYLVKIWPFRHLGITTILVARPDPSSFPEKDCLVTVVVPARNEAGNITSILDRVPVLGAGTELIFVEGNSTDDTFRCIEQEIAKRPALGAKLFQQTGKGKGDAVRLGFSKATGEVLMILDADLTVPPEDLPKFYEAWRSGKGEFINGVRLVYPMDEKAMRFFNLLGNKFFSAAFSWLLSQSVKDTLCGTKVLGRAEYEMIAANRNYFGELDPFGDFDLLFGAARFNLKIVDLPIRYRERTYGETNIQRWKHGLLLMRMLLLASRRIRFV
jgi:SAM-dependent methyltransferase